MGKQVTNIELLAQWHGGPDWFGWQSEKIVEELCRRLKPDSPLTCLRIFYPDVANLNDAAEMVDLATRKIIDRGYLKWKDPAAYARKYWKQAVAGG